MILFEIILGMLFADFFGGFVHWFEDTFIHYSTEIPALKEFARHNEMHHYFPRGMLVWSYFENVKDCILIAVGLFAVAMLFLRPSMRNHPYFFASFFTLVAFSNLFHRFSHQRESETNSVILFLQKCDILCSHAHHRQHHIAEVDAKYCTIFPFTNFLLDTTLFWRFLEKIIGFFGFQPDRKPTYDSFAPIQNYMHEDAKKECPKRPTPADMKILFEKLDQFMKPA